MLLEAAGFPVEVVEIDCEEIFPPDLMLERVAEYIANLKSEAASVYFKKDAFVLTADTVVVCQDELLEKPIDRDQAIEMLLKLSDRSHQVFTGVTINTNSRTYSLSDLSTVTLGELNTEEINYYVDKFQPFDKAGSYGIQDWIGWTKIRRIEGSYANVMGLPVDQVYQIIMDHKFQ